MMVMRFTSNNLSGFGCVGSTELGILGRVVLNLRYPLQQLGNVGVDIWTGVIRDQELDWPLETVSTGSSMEKLLES